MTAESDDKRENVMQQAELIARAIVHSIHLDESNEDNKSLAYERYRKLADAVTRLSDLGRIEEDNPAAQPWLEECATCNSENCKAARACEYGTLYRALRTDYGDKSQITQILSEAGAMVLAYALASTAGNQVKFYRVWSHTLHTSRVGSMLHRFADGKGDKRSHYPRKDMWSANGELLAGFEALYTQYQLELQDSARAAAAARDRKRRDLTSSTVVTTGPRSVSVRFADVDEICD